ncbi:hypothetical protein CEUSTIGMA_g9121.t1 [Chlamydomonas eustigma]|uniref:Uncharacterized protein n=1 Tax=Chlamydomonas eustigma TaxID=1157962 RepID=A0A250XF66_9CHLO|nr:hypothetical protein CEUSTIGMA_g9121.t1 [Chlamydomonas eustigma]|eukprot:GAX81693.1 hypothetical protein CEUSTIGMA_g9121.t1 [Chlamydomonas eustigma]
MNKDVISDGAQAQACANCVVSSSVSNVAGCLSCMGNSSNVISHQARTSCFNCIAEGNDGNGCLTCATLPNTSSTQQGLCYDCLTPDPINNTKCFNPSTNSLPHSPPSSGTSSSTSPAKTTSSITLSSVAAVAQTQSGTNSDQSGPGDSSSSGGSSTSATTIIVVAVIVPTVCVAAAVAAAMYIVRARKQRSSREAGESEDASGEGSFAHTQLPVMIAGLPMTSESSSGSLPRPDLSEEELQVQMQERREQLDHAMTARQKGDCRAAIWHYERALDVSRAIQEYSPDMYVYGQVAECYTSLGKSQKASEYYDLYVAAVDERSSRHMGAVAVYME